MPLEPDLLDLEAAEAKLTSRCLLQAVDEEILFLLLVAFQVELL